MIKKFKCEVQRTDEYIIEFDDSVIDDEFIQDFRKHFYNLTDLEEHAENIAQFRARNPDTSFIEGYGEVKVNGEAPFSFSKNDSRSDIENAINIKVISEDNDCDVDVEEVKGE